MNDQITVGLDFGTHQTKICVKKVPDEGHGQPIYEFFTFKDNDGNFVYFLPSIVQVNSDDTLSYGFVDRCREKITMEFPKRQLATPLEIDYTEESRILYTKYATNKNTYDDLIILDNLLKERKKRYDQNCIEKQKVLDEQYSRQLDEYKANRNLYRYFKQATFSERNWTQAISPEMLSIWYLSYVIFLLEKEFGDAFGINMGVPADDKSFNNKHDLAVRILLSAFRLVEDVYHNNFDVFLSEKIDVLIKKTVLLDYSFENKEDYRINVFPEAYAGLIPLTSHKKLPGGLSLTVDIGGGTTDISFFTIENDAIYLYKYWSIPHGLNFIAEESGFDYEAEVFYRKVKKDVINYFNDELRNVSTVLHNSLYKYWDKTHYDRYILSQSLKNRSIIYNGGGSLYDILTVSLKGFSVIKKVDSSLWKEENVINKGVISSFSQLLTTSYGLSLAKEESEVKLNDFKFLFSHLSNDKRDEIEMVTQDQC